MQINDRMEQLHNAVSQTYIAVEPDGPGTVGSRKGAEAERLSVNISWMSMWMSN